MIVVDSSGAGIAPSLLLLLIAPARKKVSINFHKLSITIPQPPCAGLALTLPWLDVSRCLPSYSENTRWDIIAPPSLDAASSPFPSDSIWPSSPPRAETYCLAHHVSHPLVSPAGKSHHWRGAPPVFISAGSEGLQDEAEIFARRTYSADHIRAKVVFEGYEDMPHISSMVPWDWAETQALRGWGTFCYYVVHQDGSENGRVREEQEQVWARLFDTDEREHGPVARQGKRGNTS